MIKCDCNPMCSDSRHPDVTLYPEPCFSDDCIWKNKDRSKNWDRKSKWEKFIFTLLN